MSCDVKPNVIICGAPNYRMIGDEWLKAALKRTAEAQQVECTPVTNERRESADDSRARAQKKTDNDHGARAHSGRDTRAGVVRTDRQP